MLEIVKWLKRLLGLALLPFVAALLLVLNDVVQAWIPTGGWRQTSFIWGAGGFGLWLVVYAFLPRPMWLYVLGHELTHAWAVFLCGGKVYDFKVTSQGGHVKSDRLTWFIGLAPYFVPIYAVLWMMLWVSVDFWHSLRGWEWIYCGGLGLTWGFHLTFTLSMIALGQTDISEQGRVFSFACITAANVLILLITFVLTGHGVALPMVWHSLHGRTIQCYEAVWSVVLWLWNLYEREIKHGRDYANMR